MKWSPIVRLAHVSNESQTRAKLNGCLCGTTGNRRRNVNPRRARGLLVARAADDPALAVDIDPDHLAVLDELEPRRVAVEFGPEVIGAAHEGHDAPLEFGQRHRAALLHSLEGAVRIAWRSGQRGSAGEAGGD